MKKSSSTTKLRIVFDASAVTTSGNSLNDSLIPVPCMYPAIPDLLIKFRTHKIAMTADIGKIFCEVGIQEQTMIPMDLCVKKGLPFRLPE